MHPNRDCKPCAGEAKQADQDLCWVWEERGTDAQVLQVQDGVCLQPVLLDQCMELIPQTLLLWREEAQGGGRQGLRAGLAGTQSQSRNEECAVRAFPFPLLMLLFIDSEGAVGKA